jgi:hypothetical protein
MNNKKVQFPNDEEGMKALAAYLAVIVKEGLEYDIMNGNNHTYVELTGGF